MARMSLQQEQVAQKVQTEFHCNHPTYLQEAVVVFALGPCCVMMEYHVDPVSCQKDWKGKYPSQKEVVEVVRRMDLVKVHLHIVRGYRELWVRPQMD